MKQQKSMVWELTSRINSQTDTYELDPRSISIGRDKLLEKIAQKIHFPLSMSKRNFVNMHKVQKKT